MTAIRPELPADAAVIGAITTDAFALAPHKSGTEAAIVAALRVAGALTLSLVAEEDGAVVGHVAFSPVTVDGRDVGWFALGPVAVRPDQQGRGIGAALVREGIARMREEGARGIVLVGDPAYYGRCGFAMSPGLVMPGVPPEVVLLLPLEGPAPLGTLEHHAAFGAAGT
jgi:putative acetyltransferase